MPKMTAAEAAIRVLESEGVDLVFGQPGAAILPLYQAMKARGTIRHVLVRHEEGGTHAAEGYSRASGEKIGVSIGTSGPAGTNMITGLYSAIADSCPVLCITGQAPRAKLHKEDFQAVDIAAIAKPVTKWAVTVMEAAQVPRAFRHAFHLMRSGRPGPVLIDLPVDVQKEVIEFDPESDFPLEVFRPRANPKQIEKALEMLMAAERPIIIAGGGVINADAGELLADFAEITNTPVVPTLMGWGSIPDDHRLNAGMVGIQTQHRYGNATFLRSDFVLGIGNRWANRHTGTTLGIYTKGRKFVHVDVDAMQIGKVFCPDLGIVADAHSALEQFVETARTYHAKGLLPDRSEWVHEVRSRKATMHRKTDLNDIPIKPQRVFQEINQVFDDDTRFVTAIGLYQIASGQFQRVNHPRHYLVCGQAGPLGWEIPACIGAKLAEPEREVVAVVGDLSFQFLIEELAVAAQHRVGFVMVLLNNAYLGLIRQAEMAYGMDFQVQTNFSNRNAPEIGDYGVDHVRAVEALGGIAMRVTDPKELASALQKARALAREHSVPVVVEVITERVTNIAMGTEIDQVKEFEPIEDRPLPAEFKEAVEATTLV